MDKNFQELNFEVKVPGTDFILQSNKTYRIIGRPDETAPDGFKERGITKYEHPLNGQNAIVAFDNKRKLWDTGLYSSSPCYSDSRIKPGEVKKIIKTLETNLVPFLEEIYPEGILNNNRESNKYWDSHKFNLNQNITIATSTPENFFGLWIALLHCTVAPEGEEKKPKYREYSTPYVIVNSAEKSSNLQKNTYFINKAIAKFMTGLEGDKKHLIKVLKYVEFNAASETSDSILNSTFTNWLKNKEDGAKNAIRFNDAHEAFSTEEGKEELAVWEMLVKGVKKGKVVNNRGEFFIGESSIGNNLKEAAKKINTDDKLKGELFNLVG